MTEPEGRYALVAGAVSVAADGLVAAAEECVACHSGHRVVTPAMQEDGQ